MYQVEVHSFNVGGHFHYHYYFTDEETKDRIACLEENIKEFFGCGYKLEDIWQGEDEQKNPITYITLFKNDVFCNASVEIIMGRIIPKKEYSYEC